MLTHPEEAADTEAALLQRAREGDHDAFSKAVVRHRGELHRHCYRMLGSVHDADDVLQDTMLRAWRSLNTYEGRASLRAWLYRIATNRALDSLSSRARRELPVGDAACVEPSWLQPYATGPDLAGARAGSAERALEDREDISLAFTVALQELPGRQRAALLLREVVGFSARETAELLGMTTTAVHSASQRARARLGTRLRLRAARPPSPVETAVLGQFVQAWQRGDVPGLIELLRTDATLSMPPQQLVVRGAAAVIEFIVARVGGQTERAPLFPTELNAQPAMIGYTPSTNGGHEPLGFLVLELAGRQISHLTAFPPALFERYGVAPTP